MLVIIPIPLDPHLVTQRLRVRLLQREKILAEHFRAAVVNGPTASGCASSLTTCAASGFVLVLQGVVGSGSGSGGDRAEEEGDGGKVELHFGVVVCVLG